MAGKERLDNAWCTQRPDKAKPAKCQERDVSVSLFLSLSLSLSLFCLAAVDFLEAANAAPFCLDEKGRALSALGHGTAQWES